MRLFISAGEPSGDLHGASLIRHLRESTPNLDVAGFGGDRMEDAGCRLVYPLCNHAVVGIGQALRSVPSFARILGMARDHFRAHRPDALVMIDYPGFHWWLAGAARKEGIPVSYFVPPQIWAWATWRSGKMRRLCDQVLCSLPFEESWLRQRDIPARYIGHPYFDDLAGQRLDTRFLTEQRVRPGTVVALLPGSRSYELYRNVPTLKRAAELIHERRPDVRFLVACLKGQHADHVGNVMGSTHLPIEIHHGRTPEIIELAHSCLAVSGSVSLELLYRGKPAAIVYRIHPIIRLIGHLVLRTKYITLVNLLADKLLFPEYVSVRCVAHQLAGHVLHWLAEPEAYKELCAQLAELKLTVAIPGACERAADAILELVRGRHVRLAA
jgi:lipid-A-disaccharide synthase